MGFVDKLKSIITWESMVTLCVFFLCLTGIAWLGMHYGLKEIAYGVVVAFGIPTSFFGLASAKSTSNSTNNSSEESSEILRKELDEIRVCLADTRKELLMVKTDIGVMENGSE